MSAIEYRFLEPLDVLFLRGNKLFGDPGSHGESLIPPWPSVAAGALRSRMLADDGVNLAAFARGEVAHPALGTPQQPGAFAITAFHLARRHADGTVEALIQPPADLVITEDAGGKVTVRSLAPTLLPNLSTSAPFSLVPVLAERERNKPASGYWLAESGWRKYLAGKTPDAADLVKSDALWSLDHRVGVGLDATTRRAAEGRLFSTQAIALRPGVGFLAAVSGAIPPKDGTVRLGGDGRAAAVQPVTAQLPEPDFDAITQARKCRLILTTPGLFPEGWKLPGADADGAFHLGEVRGRVVCAAIPRAEIVSGWDLARKQPKPALRVVLTGSVYWFEDLEATPGALRKLAEHGLWLKSEENDPRRAEGFNHFTLAWSGGAQE